MTWFLRLLLILAVAASGVARADDERNLAVQSGKSSEKRVALVIGNAAYGAAPLKNPVNDARAIAAKLEKLGFSVVKRENLATKQIGATLREFRSRLRPGAEALFFYAGHGLQVKGVNYLPAVDADITSEEDVPNQSINVSQLLEIMDDTKTRLNLLFLDACRNNPFTRRFRSTGGGLAKIEAPSGTKISFATRPGSVAADGEGSNGLYTEHLLRVMDDRGLPIEQALKRVYSGVKQASKGAQEPWEEGTIEGEFYFQAGSGVSTQVASLAPQLSGARTAAQIEDELWDAIKDNDKVSVLEEYLRQYPKGRYLAQARIKLAGLKTAAKPVPGAVPPAPTFAPPSAGDDPDTALWKAASQGGSADDYAVYLKQYPKGKYLGLARQRLQKLKDEARQQADAAEQGAWQAAESAQTQEGYAAYLANYPQGRYAALVQPRLVKLHAENRLREEDEAWRQAQAAATRAAMQSYMTRYPEGRYLAQARQKDEEYQRVPPRPKIPVDVSEGIWRTIEASDTYRNWPRPRSIKINEQATSQMQYTGSKSSSLATPAASRKASVREESPLGDKCSSHSNSFTVDGKSYGAGSSYYGCGFISLGGTAEGKTNSYIKSIDELKGSLFPMRIGAQVSIQTQHAYVPDRKFDSTHSISCEVVSQGPARELHPRLEGKAWKVRCRSSYSSNHDGKTTATDTENYYLEDLGILLSSIGVLNMQEKKYVVPQPGHQTVTIAEGDYGSRTTTTYANYDWTIGK